jgi:hypothetical protein
MNEHLGFSPGAHAHSDAHSVVADLRRACPALSAALNAGQREARRNREVRTRVAGRNVDPVIYEADKAPVLSVRISGKHKTIMAAHGKARWNRYGDLIAYSNHAHNHRRDCVAGGLWWPEPNRLRQEVGGRAGARRPPAIRFVGVSAPTPFVGSMKVKGYQKWC